MFNPDENSLGALQDEPSTKDWKIGRTLPPDFDYRSLPSEYDLRPFLGQVRSQGQQGACSAFAALVMKEYQEFKEDKLVTPLSPQFIYNWRSNYPRPGMGGRDVFDILNKHGIAVEEKVPYLVDVSKAPKNMATDVLEEAQNFRVQAYAKVETQDEVKAALYRDGPVWISFPVFENTTNGQLWLPPSQDAKRIGGHAMAIVAYDGEGFIIRNSWGSEWNGNGHTKYHYKDWGSHWDIWTAIDMASDVLDHLKYGDRVIIEDDSQESSSCWACIFGR